MQVNSSSVLSLGNYSPTLTSGVTISAWIQPTSNSSVEARLLSKATSVSGNDHQLMVGGYFGTALRFRLRTNNSTSTLISTTGYLAPNQWSFVTFTYDLQNMKIYHDGVMIAQVAKTGPVTLDSSVPMAIGNQPAGAGDRPFDGLIDDLRIYDGALSDSEIATLMAHRPGDCGDLPIEAPVALSATTNDTDIQLSWDAPANVGAGISHYQVTRDGSIIAAVVNQASYTDADISVGATYVYSVRAVDINGTISPASNTVSVNTSDTLPPDVPSNLAVSSSATDSISLSWDASADAGGSGTRQYHVTRNNGTPVTVASTSFTDTGLAPDTTYTYSVTAEDNAGNFSLPATIDADTDIVIDQTAPGTPANLVATEVTSTSIALMWDSVQDLGGSGLAGYSVSRDGNFVLQTDSTSFTDNGLSPDTTYSYAIRAIDEAGNISDPVTLSETTPGSGGGQCNELDEGLLNHYAFDTLLNGQFVDRTGAQNGTYLNVAPANGQLNNAVSFTDNSSLSLGNYSPTLTSGVTISAWIQPTSNSSVEARLLSKATSVSGNDHQLMVGGYFGTALRFRLRTNNSTSTLISTTGYLAPNQWSFVTFTYDLQNMKIYHDGVMIAQVAKTGPVTLDSSVPMAIGNQPAGAGDRPFDGLIDDLRIYDGALSDSEIATLMAHRPGDCGDLPIEAPVALSATTNDTDIQLSWDAPANVGAGISHYQVTRDGSIIAAVVNQASYTDADISVGATYVYSVRAVDINGTISPASNTVSVNTSDTLPPDVPSNLAVSSSATDSISLSWDASADAGGSGTRQYHVTRNNGTPVTVASTSFTDTGLAPDTTYTYSVTAEDNAGNFSLPATIDADTDIVIDQTAPGTPANLVATEVTSTSIALMWDSVQDLGGSGLAGYSVSRDGNFVLQTDSTSFTDNGLSPDTTYSYAIRAIDEAGNISDPVTLSETTPGSGGGQCNELDEGLLNHYAFDTLLNGQFVDRTGAQNGTYLNVAPANGQLNNAVSFTDNSSLSLGNYSPAVANGLTISAWIKPSSTGSPEARFLSKASGVQEQDHHIMIGSYYGNRLRFRLKAGGATTTLITAPGVLNDNQWNFVTFSYDQQKMRIYNNGNQIAQTSKIGLVSIDNTVAMAIGNQPSGAGDRHFAGDIDELRMYGRALSDAEIASLMSLQLEDCNVALSAPNNLSAALGESEVDLTWSPPTSIGAGLDYYEVARDGVLIAVNVNGTAFSDTTYLVTPVIGTQSEQLMSLKVYRQCPIQL